MTVDEMLAGDWKLLIDEAPADLAKTVTFDAGVVRESGLHVGTYAVAGDRLEANIGDDLALAVTLPDLSPLLPGIEAVKPNLLSAVATTRIPEAAGLPEMDGEDLVEPAALFRVIGDRVPIKRALAA